MRKIEQNEKRINEIEVELKTFGISSEVHRDKLLDEKKNIESQLAKSVTDLSKITSKFKNDDDRLNFMNELTNGYCKYCGCYEGDYSCLCWNDD